MITAPRRPSPAGGPREPRSGSAVVDVLLIAEQGGVATSRSGGPQPRASSRRRQRQKWKSPWCQRRTHAPLLVNRARRPGRLRPVRPASSSRRRHGRLVAHEQRGDRASSDTERRRRGPVRQAHGRCCQRPHGACAQINEVAPVQAVALAIALWRAVVGRKSALIHHGRRLGLATTGCNRQSQEYSRRWRVGSDRERYLALDCVIQ
jgi:hypothetical protein